MDNITFSSLNLTIDKTVTSITLPGGKAITIKKYLPIEDKISLVQIALQQAADSNIYNTLRLDAYVYLYIVYFYTNLEFTDEEKANPMQLFDILNSNGIIGAVTSHIPEAEFTELMNFVEKQLDLNIKVRTSFAYTFNNLIEKIEDAVKYLNEEDFKTIINNAVDSLSNSQKDK
jgi:hypothetical protein